MKTAQYTLILGDITFKPDGSIERVHKLAMTIPETRKETLVSVGETWTEASGRDYAVIDGAYPTHSVINLYMRNK